MKTRHAVYHTFAYGVIGRHHGKSNGCYRNGKTKRVVQPVHVELLVAYLRVYRHDYTGAVAPHYAHRVRLCSNVCHAQ